MNIIFLTIGLAAGILGGIVGVGGGIVIIPALIYFAGFDQHTAQGTTLAAMVPPIGILAAIAYYREGFVEVPVAAFIATGFVLGGFLGAKIAIGFDPHILKRIFGIILFLLSLKMIIGR